MPLGDGKGPPEGTGPMTGRRRLFSACARRGSVERESSGFPWLLLGLLIAALFAMAELSESRDD